MTHRYEVGMKGFAATIPDQFLTTLQSLQGDEIDYIGEHAVGSRGQRSRPAQSVTA